tara:strand:+ start:13472 stop:14908 length:1437 start_codon:yes stop_codon:yes gene_type:complete
MLFNSALFKIYKTPLLIACSSLLLFAWFGYGLERTDYTKLIFIYSTLFFLFYKLMQTYRHNIQFLTVIAFLFKAVFIMGIPNLSQDFYRFIWDGRMILEGFNPYLYTVESFIAKGEFPVAQSQELYTGMGMLNASHFTNYPPLNQLCFVIAGLFTGKSILGSAIVMRLLIIAADFGTLYFGKKLLERLNMPVYHIFWYVLNPFIIIELTGNLHFEGIMIFFLVWCLYLLQIGKWPFAAVVLACSVSIKLIPLIFLPLFFQWFVKRKGMANGTKPFFPNNEIALSLRPHNDVKKGMTKLIAFYGIIGMTTLLFFAPFYTSEFIANYTKTVGLWFHKFEFNASLYYIARSIGYFLKGWNQIAIIGKITPVVMILFILILSFFRRNKTTVQFITAMLLVLSFYYFTATTVHPWYVATLLILSVFTKYKFPLVWSFAIILSYLAYSNTDNQENLWIIGLEYVVVYGVFICDVFIEKASQKEA